MLLKTQNNIVKLLYNQLINENNSTILNIVGEKGSGKHIILEELVSTLKENWDFHYILGYDEILVNRKSIETKNRHEFFPLPSISLKLGIITIGSSLRFQEVDSIFHDIEKQFIKEVNRDHNNSLIIIENYHKLDECTKRFVNTILATNNNFSKKNVYYIITSNEIISKDYNIIKVNSLEEEDIKELIYQINSKLINDSKKILKLSKGNYELAVNLIKYGLYDNDVLEEIIDKRISDVQKIISGLTFEEIYEICTYGTYFLNNFSVKQIHSIYNKEIDSDVLFKLFCKLSYIGIVKSNQLLINYNIIEFKQIIKRKSLDISLLYLEKFYLFYTNNYDHLYSERLEYLLQLYLKNNSSSNFNKKITGLLFSTIILKIYNGSLSSIDQLESFLKNITLCISDIYTFPMDLYCLLRQLIEKNLTYSEIKKFNFEDEDILVKSEIIRLTLILMNEDNISTEIMNQHIKKAINFMTLNNEFSKEKYASLRLQDAVISQLQRSTLYDTFDKELEKYDLQIESYCQRDLDIHNTYKYLKYRRSSLYEKCDVSIEQIKKAIKFNFENNNIYELFYCYVNLMGLYAINSNEDEDEYKKLNNKIKKMLEENNSLYFKKIYKYKNNALLYEYKNEIKNQNDINKYLNIVIKYYNEFKNLYKECNSRVVRLNYISLLCQINIEEALKEINEFLKDNGNKHNFDSFYIYYLNNLKIVLYIIKKDWEKANNLMNYVLEIELPHYNLNEIYYKKRLEGLKLIIENKLVCNSIKEYDNIIHDTLINLNITNEYFNGLDKSWEFFSKAFIMSDLQYFD